MRLVPEWLKLLLIGLAFGGIGVGFLFSPGRLLEGSIGVAMGVMGITTSLVEYRKRCEFLLRPEKACIHCGYDLRHATSLICPECGKDQRTQPDPFRDADILIMSILL